MDAPITSVEETKNEKILKKIALYGTGLFFIIAGSRHFLVPEFYMLMMPNYLPVPLTLIYISGAFEILGGIGLMVPKTRAFSAWGLMALLLAVLPANVYMWTHRIPLPDTYTPSWLLMLRIPLQFLLIAWVYLFAKNPKGY
jgi:uncharacterized membrane protein